MAPTWHSTDPPDGAAAIGLAGGLRVAVRGAVLVALMVGGLVLMLALRLIERPLFGARRPVTPWITRGVCRAALSVLGIGYDRRGAPMAAGGDGALCAQVANHSSWLDILVLNAGDRVYFVAKSEVARWPGIGWLARATGTLFIRRAASAASAQRDDLTARLAAGHRLLFFPEGTSTDGRRVLAFKSTLFAAFFDPALRHRVRIQPVSVAYRAPPDAPDRFYAWWGDMSLGPHLVKLLAHGAPGRVEVRYHPPIAVADVDNRKALAAQSGAIVAEGFAAARGPTAA